LHKPIYSRLPPGRRTISIHKVYTGIGRTVIMQYRGVCNLKNSYLHCIENSYHLYKANLSALRLPPRQSVKLSFEIATGSSPKKEFWKKEFWKKEFWKKESSSARVHSPIPLIFILGYTRSMGYAPISN